MKVAVLFTLAAALTAGERVEFVERSADRQIDVLFDGMPFTSWIYWDSQMKPILYPLRTARGTVVTRGYPIDKVPGEKTDHRHHAGAWFNHGNVNGVDFWNNGGSPKMGRVIQTAVSVEPATQSIRASMNWVMPEGSVVLGEEDVVRFGGRGPARWIDRRITLTARNSRVVFGGSKNGAFGIRVARALEEPMTEPEVLTDHRGEPSGKPVVDNRAVNGVYLSSSGRRGEKEAWGKRDKWMTLSGKVSSEDVAIAIFDHPKNPTYPTYWHSRGYGLFSANPFGGKEYTSGADSKEYALEPGESMTLRFRILIHSGRLEAAGTEDLYQAWLREVRD